MKRIRQVRRKEQGFGAPYNLERVIEIADDAPLPTEFASEFVDAQTPLSDWQHQFPVKAAIPGFGGRL